MKYEAEVSSAPVVLAKGEDYLAQKIKGSGEGRMKLKLLKISLWHVCSLSQC
ncbi:MAG: EscU/YscU/HrcU family type III secretion system export apparatus switch protein [Lachnospira sp.]